ncbi:helix-turn-helix transcriptional regulator [Sphingomonas hylomeconis]|uniref:LuxR C-terminal-related transcriptional regulator n=1 Tax=Sphingomonas hylomeconis TaxID=1395958 RepID=A0ABV7SUY8_9SPHN|nr:LuxR C-terminal-related transcriptional regulator [Sphingomonas hylomeconis]
MTQIQQIKEWRASTACGAVYEKLLQAIGTEEFGSTVRDSVMTVTAGARRVYLFEAKGRLETSLQYYSCEPGVTDLFPLYSKSYLQLDPIHDACRATPACSDLAYQRIRPSDIASAGFRRRIFDDAGIIERVSIVQRGSDAWRALSVARHKSDGYFTDDEVTALINLAWLALPMLPMNRARAETARELSVPQLEDRFGARFPDLTRREREVCARAAVGMTVEATALDLGVGKASVLTYRQRAYGRLSVTSPYQLCSLVSH